MWLKPLIEKEQEKSVKIILGKWMNEFSVSVFL